MELRLCLGILDTDKVQYHLYITTQYLIQFYTAQRNDNSYISSFILFLGQNEEKGLVSTEFELDEIK